MAEWAANPYEEIGAHLSGQILIVFQNNRRLAMWELELQGRI
jgi:hypothetical protein